MQIIRLFISSYIVLDKLFFRLPDTAYASSHLPDTFSRNIYTFIYIPETFFTQPINLLHIPQSLCRIPHIPFLAEKTGIHTGYAGYRKNSRPDQKITELYLKPFQTICHETYMTDDLLKKDSRKTKMYFW